MSHLDSAQTADWQGELCLRPFSRPRSSTPRIFGLPEGARGDSETLDLGSIESQCGGVNESQNVETYDGTLGVSVELVRRHQRAVGQTMRGTTRSCSGTLIGNDLFLSAGHCFDANPNPQTQVTFNFQTDAAGNPLPEQRFPILAVLEHRLGGLDYEIIRLGNNPAGNFGFTLVSPVDPAVGDMACIIGHPATAPKQIEAGPVTALSGNQIRYNDADTLPSNSGSGILHAPSGRVIGVHTNGGCNGTTPETGFNLGMRISSRGRFGRVGRSQAMSTSTPVRKFGRFRRRLGAPGVVRRTRRCSGIESVHRTGQPRPAARRFPTELPEARTSHPPLCGGLRTAEIRIQGSGPPNRADRLAGSPRADRRSRPSGRRRTSPVGRGPVPRWCAAQPCATSIFGGYVPLCRHASLAWGRHSRSSNQPKRVAALDSSYGSSFRSTNSSVPRFRSCCLEHPPRFAVHIPRRGTIWQQEP